MEYPKSQYNIILLKPNNKVNLYFRMRAYFKSIRKFFEIAFDFYEENGNN